MTSRLYKFVIGAIVVLHIFLTPVLVQLAYSERGGRLAFGGEYLVLPFIAILMLLIVSAIENQTKKNNFKGE